jgi:hypothetical protein
MDMRWTAKKERVTLSLSNHILTAIDKTVESSRLSRSGVVEGILEGWYEQEMREQLSREAAEYYQSLTAKERREEAAIAKSSLDAARQVWGGDE